MLTNFNRTACSFSHKQPDFQSIAFEEKQLRNNRTIYRRFLDRIASNFPQIYHCPDIPPTACPRCEMKLRSGTSVLDSPSFSFNRNIRLQPPIWTASTPTRQTPGTIRTPAPAWVRTMTRQGYD